MVVIAFRLISRFDWYRFGVTLWVSIAIGIALWVSRLDRYRTLGILTGFPGRHPQQRLADATRFALSERIIVIDAVQQEILVLVRCAVLDQPGRVSSR